MTSTSTYAAIAVVLAVCVAGAIAAVLAAGPVVARRDSPHVWEELPGGFDPSPDFDRTSHELQFRGAACGRVADDRYVLVRECSSDSGRE